MSYGAEMIVIGVEMALILVLVIVEIALRLRDGVAIPFLGIGSRADAAGLTSFLRTNPLRYHRRLGWTMRPNTQVRVGAFSLTTDAMGNRLTSPSFRPLPIGGVVVCGNSFPAGADVADAESWPAMLEAMIGEPVVNASCGGWGADQAIMQAQEMLSLARPKTLIVSLFPFDFQRAEFATYHYTRKAYFVLKGDGLYLKDSPVPLFNEIPSFWADRLSEGGA